MKISSCITVHVFTDLLHTPFSACTFTWKDNQHTELEHHRMATPSTEAKADGTSVVATTTTTAAVAAPVMTVMEQLAHTHNDISLAEMDIIYNTTAGEELDKQFKALENHIKTRVDFLRDNLDALREHVEDGSASRQTAKRLRTDIQTAGGDSVQVSAEIRASVDRIIKPIVGMSAKDFSAMLDYFTCSIQRACATREHMAGMTTLEGYI